MTDQPGAEEPDRIELVVNGGEHILILDGRVVEGFYAPNASSRRFHVEHFDAASKPKRFGEGHKVYIGKMMSGNFPDAWIIDNVSDAELPEIEKFIAIAKSRKRLS